MTHLLTIRKIMRKGTQRGTTCVHGRSQSAWLVKLENDVPAKPWRRVYKVEEHFNTARRDSLSVWDNNRNCSHRGTGRRTRRGGFVPIARAPSPAIEQKSTRSVRFWLRSALSWWTRG